MVEEKQKAEMSLSSGFKAKPVPASTFRSTNTISRTSTGSRYTKNNPNVGMNESLSSVNQSFSNMNLSQEIKNQNSSNNDVQTKNFVNDSGLQKNQPPGFQFRLI